MKKIIVIAFWAAVVVSVAVDASAQQRQTPFHAGIHSGSYTLAREQQLERESKDPRLSCPKPYCSRCSKHLADYGHEYQLIDGPSQAQPFYRGTRTGIAHATAGCDYDEHSSWYQCRGLPVATMSWEYQCYLNHAIKEQVAARNAVAAQEACEDAVEDLTSIRPRVAARAQASNSDQDREALAAIDQQLVTAKHDLKHLTAIADEKVRIALLSKEDADKATRYKRIFHKPPKYKEVLAAREAAEEQRKNTAETEKESEKN